MKINIENGIGIKVLLNKKGNSPKPFGLDYYAKGFYYQKIYIIIVGHLNNNLEEISTIRIKYKREEILAIVFL
jgi:hypothetical protein